MANQIFGLAFAVPFFFIGAVVPASAQRTRAVIELPFEISSNLIVLKVTLNGSMPLPFILDTGATSSVVSVNRSKELGLKLEPAKGADTQGGTVEASLVKKVSIGLGDANLQGVDLSAIRLDGLEAGLGRHVDGIIGGELFKRYVVEIDYPAGRLRLHEPVSYRYPGNGGSLPLLIKDNTPFVRAWIEIRPGHIAEDRLLIDTGATGALNLNTPFVKQNKAMEGAGKTVGVTSGALLAGKSNARVGRVRSVKIGRFSIPYPVTNFSMDTEGDSAETDNAGTIGGEVLRRFKVVLDYSRRRMFLEPNGSIGEPYPFDMSGASLTAVGENLSTIRVRTIIAGSPAAEAGLRPGDVILAIDSKPTTALRLDQIRQMFRQPGHSYALEVTRGPSHLNVRLKTRKLL